MRGIPRSVLGRICSAVLASLLVAGPVLQAGPAFAFSGDEATTLSAPVAPDAPSTESAVESSPTVVRELIEKRTENSTHYLLSDGSIRAEFTEVPTRFEDESGKWADINPSLVPAPEPGAMQTAATSVTVTFEGAQTAEAPVNLSGDGFSVGLDMLGVAEGARITYGDTTRYLNVASSTDLEYQATRTGIKETVVIKDVSAPSSYEFRVSLEGLEVRQDPFGRYALYAEGESDPLFDLGALVVYDSSENEAGEPAVCQDAQMSVRATGDGDAIVTYEVAREWIDAPERVFPIMVDPTITGAADTADTFISSKYPTTSYGGSTELKCGYYDSTTGHNRSLVKFYWTTSDIPVGSYISDAKLNLYVFHRYSSASNTVRIGKVSGSWGNSTWNERPSWSYLGNMAVTGLGYMAFDCDDTVKGWVDNYSTNYGFMAYQMEDSSEMTIQWKKFYSSDYSVSSQLPKLVVTYSNPNVTGSNVDKTVYRIGDTVSATIKIGTSLPEDINCIQATLRGTGTSGSQTKGVFQWTEEAPETTWSNSTTNLSGIGGGYVSSKSLSGVTFLPTQCTENVPNDSSADNAEVVLKWRIDDSYGDIQDNDIDVVVRMDPTNRNESGNRWSSATKIVDSSYAVAPKPTTNLGYTTAASSGWFREVDRDNDGKADTANDKVDQGRGSVSLSWSTSPLADGYRIYAFDGSSYRKVGETLGNTSTTWSSAGGRFFPADSDYVSRADDSWSANPYAASAPFVSGTEQVSITTTGAAGAGVVVTDGSHLYYRGWGSSPYYPGPTQWTQIGSGLNGASAASEPVGIGPSFASKPILSAFYQDGVIYNGYATSATSIEGVPVSAASGDAGTRALTFSAPLLDRMTGNVLSGASGNVLLAATDERIYSVAYNRNGTDVKDGFKIREFTRDGVFVADRTVACTSYLTDGLMADGDNLYFIEWYGKKQVTKVSTSSWKITNQYVSNSSNNREINGCYDAANNVFWTGTLDNGGVIRRYAGLGHDLRDSPNQLYAKTPGDNYDANTNYWFRVVPFSEVAELTVSENPYVTPTLDNRTVRVNDDPRHTTYDLGTIDDHDASVTLDEAELDLDTTDLSIASWGPTAELSRHYSSGSSYIGAFAPGWRFNFEQTFVVSGNVTELTDATGEVHRFTRNLSTNLFEAPNGDYSKVEYTGVGWRITDKDRTVTRFDLNGVLTSVTDRNGNQVTYVWTTGPKTLTVTAANGQSIVAQFNLNGKITGAIYAVTDARIPQANRSRVVSYNEGAGYTCGTTNQVTRPTTDVEYVADANGRITDLSNPTYSGSPEYPAVWSFEYGEATGRLHGVQWPGRNNVNSNLLRETGLTYDTAKREATIITWPTVDGVVQETDQKIAWNPTGTEASRTNKYAPILGGPGAAWSYTYNPQSETASEKSPEGVTTNARYDSRGNVTHAFDGKGGMTANVYDAADNLIRTTSPAGRTTYSTYDARGNLTAEERVLTAAGERSRTVYAYDTQGRGLLVSELRRISQGPDTWAETQYVESSIALNGEAQTVIDKGVKLTSSATAVDLTKTKAYDAFGNLLWEKDASGQWVSRDNEYDIAGRLMSSTDASGTIARTDYDKVGFEQESWREHGSDWAERKRTDRAPDGRVLSDTQYKRGEDGAPVPDYTVVHEFDNAGNEIRQISSAGTTEVKYNPQGLVTSQHDPGTYADTASTADYDADGNLVESTPAGNSEADETAYDDAGNVVEDDPAGKLDADLDPENDDDDATTYDFDEDGNVTTVSVPADDGGTIVAAASFYDVGGRQTKSTDAKGFVTTFTYDQLDRQLAATAGGVSATKIYNTLGWMLSETDLDGQTKTFGYDETGRVESETLAGKTTTMDFDGMGRVVSTTKPDGSAVAYGYDEFGRSDAETHTVPGQSEPVRAIKRTFDEQSRELTNVDSARGVASSSVWDGESRSLATRAYGDTTVTVSFDAQGRESEVESVLGTASASREVASRDHAGRTTMMTLDAGLPLSQGYTYEPVAGKLVAQSGAGLGTGGIAYDYNAYTARQDREKIDLSYPSAAADRDRTFAYDDAGRLVGSTDAGSASVISSYTPDGRIITNGARSFSYCSETTRTQQLLSMVEGGKTTSYEFDDRGRRKRYFSADESATYGYNDDDRLASFAKDKGKDGSLDVTATYTYDGEGQRTRSVVTSGGVTTSTEWTYEGLTLLRSAWVTSNETTTVEYVNDDAGRPLGAWVTVPGRATTEFVWLITDARGDVLELLTSGGAPLSYRTYSAYGETTSGASQAAGSIAATQSVAIDAAVRLRYAGYTLDEESGLYYCAQRYYDPGTCQWITKDPARADGEESAYQYCAGDPVGCVDQTGLFALNGSRFRPGDYLNAVRYPKDIKYVKASWNLAMKYQQLYYPKTFKYVTKDGKTKWNFGGDAHTGNAFKHACWNALMVSKFAFWRKKTPWKARVRAAEWATGHENGDTGRLTAMDKFNNYQGRELGQQYWWQTDDYIAARVHDAVKSGKMRYLKKDKNGNRTKWAKTRS